MCTIIGKKSAYHKQMVTASSFSNCFQLTFSPPTERITLYHIWGCVLNSGQDSAMRAGRRTSDFREKPRMGIIELGFESSLPGKKVVVGGGEFHTLPVSIKWIAKGSSDLLVHILGMNSSSYPPRLYKRKTWWTWACPCTLPIYFLSPKSLSQECKGNNVSWTHISPWDREKFPRVRSQNEENRQFLIKLN